MYRIVLLMSALVACAAAHAEQSTPWVDTVASRSRDLASGVATSVDGSVFTFGRFSTHLAAAAPGHRLFNRGHYDLFLLRHDADGQRSWIRAIGGAGNENAGDLLVTRDGQVCVSGSFEGRAGGIRDGLPELVAHGMSDGFVGCYGFDGAPAWMQRLGGKGADQLHGLAESSAGELLVAGEFTHAAAPTVAAGSRSIVSTLGQRAGLFLRLARSGTVASSRVFEATPSASVRDVVALPDGGAALLLRFEGRLLLREQDDIHRQIDSGRRSDLMLIRLSAEDEILWSRHIGGPGAEDGAELAVNDRGEIAVVGSFIDSIHGSAAQRTSAGSSDVFLATYATSGDPLLFRSFGADQADVGYAVVADDDRWLLALSFIDHTRIDDIPLRGIATSAALVSVDPLGNARVSRRIDGEGLEQIVSLARQVEGSFAVAGAFNGSLLLDADERPRRPLNKLDAFVAIVALEPAEAGDRPPIEADLAARRFGARGGIPQRLVVHGSGAGAARLAVRNAMKPSSPSAGALQMRGQRAL